MANPFKEAEKAKKTAPGSKQNVVTKKEEPKKEENPVVKPVVKEETPVKKEEPAVVVVPEEKKEENPVVKAEPEKKEEQKETKDIFAGLSAEKPTGKTYAFYLSDENVNKLKKMAEKKGISASKLLDHILSEVL